MARVKARKKEAEKPPLDRAIAFRAPNQVHGALKKITGQLEMTNTIIDDHIPYERDIITWMIGEMYLDGPDKWPERIKLAHDRYVQFMASTAL